MQRIQEFSKSLDTVTSVFNVFHADLYCYYHQYHYQCDDLRCLSSPADCFVGLVVKASASRAEDPGFEPHMRQAFSGSSHTSDFKIGTPAATLPGAWRYRVITGTGWPGVSIL